MNPTMSPQATGVATVSRNVLCCHYSQCLDLAILKGWSGFSCENCQCHELELPNDVDHWKDQAGRCRLLMAKIFAPKPTSRRRKSVVPTRNRNDFPMSEKDLYGRTAKHRMQDCIDHGTVQLPEDLLAHLMHLWEYRPHE